MMKKINGVNLGNWLVLEKWMSPALFDGTTAEDEYYLAHQLSPQMFEMRLKIHRSEYITERDFAHIAHMGMNSVRIPIPYFIFGDRPPFVGCIEELDKAFCWAEKYGLSILLDLHTVPMSQNGFDNGGISGVCKWSQMPEEVDFVLDVLERLAQRYGTRKGLLGIEPVNEPLTDAAWDVFDISNRYPPVDPELEKGSAPITLEFLRDFYTKAYDRIRKHMNADKYVVFHDGFQLHAWKDFFQDGNFRNVILDTHQYLMMAESMGCEQTQEGYLSYIQEHYAKEIAQVQEYVDVICGEWSLFNSLAVGVDTKGGQSVLNGMDFSQQDNRLSDTNRKQLYRSIAQAQLDAWNHGCGHYYWNYKLLLDPANDPNWYGWDCWDLGKSVSEGWFPVSSGT